ncbi:hypothetical protein VDBG_06036 [Verticillium alfalfae VaMs.102]|uniref:Uncharacterized protein n=1 Tax=Verticillium alfalfae (strain VaMs.102 / ATCC MYA-4576 / FGSC 10136) TaxID=526221 RepID=C9SMB2_VERA1|nr:hypothetical protein VDBG_06036 [Verticillium alfalfae VaMs.102]EEY19927.1 hypothetical protein VDBG_06036 [Verticillium alfalfae VaMs.102]
MNARERVKGMQYMYMESPQPATCGSGSLVRTAMATGVVNGLVGSIVGTRVPEMSSSSAPSNGGVHEEPDGQGSRSSTVRVGQ